MASAREMRLRIKSVKNIAQVTRALEAVSAAKVRKSVQAVAADAALRDQGVASPHACCGAAGPPESHPLLSERPDPRAALVIVITGDRASPAHTTRT